MIAQVRRRIRYVSMMGKARRREGPHCAQFGRLDTDKECLPLKAEQYFSLNHFKTLVSFYTHFIHTDISGGIERDQWLEMG